MLFKVILSRLLHLSNILTEEGKRRKKGIKGGEESSESETGGSFELRVLLSCRAKWGEGTKRFPGTEWLLLALRVASQDVAEDVTKRLSTTFEARYPVSAVKGKGRGYIFHRELDSIEPDSGVVR